MFFGTLRTNKALMTVFGSLTILFWLLAAGDLSGEEVFTRIAGWEGLFVGLSAMYLGIAQVLNESFGRTVLPIGPHR
jgi:succinate-acetate transporter protein